VFGEPGTAPMQGAKVVPTMHVGSMSALIAGVPSPYEGGSPVDVVIQVGRWRSEGHVQTLPANLILRMQAGHDSISVCLTLAQVMLMAQEMIRLSGVAQKLHEEFMRNANR